MLDIHHFHITREADTGRVSEVHRSKQCLLLGEFWEYETNKVRDITQEEWRFTFPCSKLTRAVGKKHENAPTCEENKTCSKLYSPQIAIIDAMLSLSRNIKYILYITVHLLGDKFDFT